nr:hypothetical protein BaRGS_004339 [Batillaria attramentaria]
MYDFYNKADVKTAVNELAAAANNGELYIIADEAVYGNSYNRYNPSGRFSEFVTHLSNRVPSLHLWAAAVDRQDLQYRDTIILCHVPRDDLPVVSRLRARGLPVQVVTSRDDEATIRNLALNVNNKIMVTDRLPANGNWIQKIRHALMEVTMTLERWLANNDNNNDTHDDDNDNNN